MASDCACRNARLRQLVALLADQQQLGAVAGQGARDGLSNAAAGTCLARGMAMIGACAPGHEQSRQLPKQPEHKPSLLDAPVTSTHFP